MGWAVGFSLRHDRDIGYGVPCLCEHPDCHKRIHRGLAYVCGGDVEGGEHGCGMFFCDDHRYIAGDKRSNASLCKRCRYGHKPYPLKPDVIEWVRWKLQDRSWAKWREAYPDKVKAMRERLA